LQLIIRRALLEGGTKLRDIGIENGRVSQIAPRIPGKGETEIDAKGALVCPSFVDAHLHLDKALLYDRFTSDGAPRVIHNQAEFVTYAINAENDLKKNFTVADVKSRAKEVIEMAVAAGTGTIVAHVDIDPYAGLTGLKGVLEAKKENKDLVDIKTVAFPQNGILKTPGMENMMNDALKLGADVVGGLPDLEKNPEDQIDFIFEIAKKFGTNINCHLDQAYAPKPFSLPYMAKKTIEEGFEGRVTVAHVYNLSAVPLEIARQALRMVRDAAISICFHNYRMLVPGSSELLLGSGVNLALISDNIRDVWYAIGNGDLLLNALMLAFCAYGFSISENEWRELFNLITYNAARAVWIGNDYGVKDGNAADLIVLDAKTMADAIASQRPRRYVLKGGSIVARYGKIVARNSDGS
jgi:cytosine deaminase